MSKTADDYKQMAEDKIQELSNNLYESNVKDFDRVARNIDELIKLRVLEGLRNFVDGIKHD